MCSRYSLTSPAEAVRSYFRLETIDPFPPRYNIAPTQPVGIVRLNYQGRREFHLVRWGLIPSWLKDPSKISTLINARSETAAEKPSFRGGMRHRRCLVPANGFYEWTGPARAKTPHLIRPKDARILALAGIADHWVGADGSELETVAILTTAANATIATVHDRMPVILPAEAYDEWLDCRSGSSVDVARWLVPAAEDLLEIVEIEPLINDVRREGSGLQVPAAPRLI